MIRLVMDLCYPNRGAWLELETDSKTCLRIDRTREIPFTTCVLLDSLEEDEIIDIFGDGELVRNTIEKDITKINGFTDR